VIAPFDAKILKSLSPRLTGYEVNKKTVRVPTDWKVDAALLDAMIRPQLAAGDATRGAAKLKKKSKKSSRKSTR